jgi:hypothetical protein
MLKYKKMKRLALFFTFLVIHGLLHAGNVEKTYYFSDYKINNTGSYQSITFPDTKLSAFPGDPMLPYQAVALMLPPGESALTIGKIPSLSKAVRKTNIHGIFG